MSMTQQPGILDRLRQGRFMSTIRAIRRGETTASSLGLLVILLLAGPAASQAQADPLHEQIDRLIEAGLAQSCRARRRCAGHGRRVSAARMARPGRHDPQRRRGTRLP